MPRRWRSAIAPTMSASSIALTTAIATAIGNGRVRPRMYVVGGVAGPIVSTSVMYAPSAT